MKSLSSFKRILLYRGVVDFRKWINGLALTVEHELKESLVEDGTLFVFISRNRRKVSACTGINLGWRFGPKVSSQKSSYLDEAVSGKLN